MYERKRNVRINLAVRHDGEETVVEAAGEAARGEGEWIVRYREPSTDLAGVTTTLVLSRDEIAVLREGAVRAEQRFAAGRRLAGRYETPYGTFALETNTFRLAVRLGETAGEAEWAYELSVGGAAAGTFFATLHVQEAEA